MSEANQLVVLTGGGTGGSVTPLLAMADDLKQRGYELAWLGTREGIEKKMVTEAGITYHGIAAGKLRRYFSLENLIDPFRIFAGFFQALSLLSTIKPRIVITAGGFVSVPVVWAAWSLRIKIIVHQQDLRPGLANRLMAPLADIVTVTFEKSLKDYGVKALWTGNPLRWEFIEEKNNFNSNTDASPERMKKVLMLGGGTGSEAINKLVRDSLGELTKICEVTHVTGEQGDDSKFKASDHYHPFAFLRVANMAKAMAGADLVVTRAGLGTLTELSYLGKATIIIPMPESHQEDNAEFFHTHEAAIVLSQKALNSTTFTSEIIQLLQDEAKRAQLSKNMVEVMKQDGNTAVARLIQKLLI